MIRSFADKETEGLFEDKSVRRFSNIKRPARRKLLLLHVAKIIDDLRIPPGNRLEALKGNTASA